MAGNSENDSPVEKALRALDPAKNLPPSWILGVILLVLGVAVFFVIPLTGITGLGGQTSWSSGPLASPHQVIAHDCHACHDGGFRRISDNKCMSCHKMSDHSASFAAAHQGLFDEMEPSCATCHLDHNGPHGLILNDDRLCSDCHANLSETLDRLKPGARTDLRNISNFSNHPEFAVTLQGENGKEGPRVTLDDTAKLRDNSHLKLNHKIHLQPDLRTRTGAKTLTCQDCHALAPDYRTISPIRFEEHCAECHGLEFDERLPGIEVPHGDPNVVYRFLYAEYAKLLLGSEDSSPSRAAFERRGGRIPGRAMPESNSADDFSRAFVEQESRSAERVLFTRTACLLCHDVNEKKLSEGELREGVLARFEVLAPQVPNPWMPKAIFNHGSHEELTCETCHKGALKSELTSDVLLPKIENCRECHISNPHPGSVRADCITCHSYHDPMPFQMSEKRPLSEVRR